YHVTGHRDFSAPSACLAPFSSIARSPKDNQCSGGDWHSTSTMANSFTLPLRPLLEKNDRSDSLSAEIAQINNQWGSFRDVNEEILRTEIAKEKEQDGSQDDEGAGEADTTERLEQLYKRRAEITKFAMQAHMETMFALDFVSLVLSKHAPRQAETSMSAYLKQVAPLGSLSSEVVTPPPKPESAKKDISVISRGWRIQNFNSAANKLLSAASRLETEVASEARYWNEVLEVKNKGWKICRLPRERQSLGVQYGFLEATPIFRDRGLACLRRADDGGLILDRGLVPSKPRLVRVQVKRHDQIVSCSTLPRPTSNDPESIERRILQARDTVFEEELFHELVREARPMATHGVTTRQNLIRIPTSEDHEILIDLVDANDDRLQSNLSHSQQDLLLADALALSIRILLSYAHRQNLRRRTQAPPPLTPKRRPIPEYHLLRPAIAYFQHMSHVRWLETFFKDIFGVLQAAGLDSARYIADLASTWKPANASRAEAPVEAFVEKFLTPLESTFSGSLLTPQGSFIVTIRTNLASPPFGTNFEVSCNMPKYADLKSPGRIASKDEVEAAITHLLMLDIVFTIASHAQPTPKPVQDLKESETWDVVYPHLGELIMPSSNPERHTKMKVVLSRSELSLEAYTVCNIDGIGRGRWEFRSEGSKSRTWKSSVSLDQPALMDFIAAESSCDK
ncbi:hypothetical protein N7510_002770, partial [Penicillium lagena]|uniref:uncharacterized protein n=1 Tax=Penicillium lagena TaxID=94218 RepID=UPI002541D859